MKRTIFTILLLSLVGLVFSQNQDKQEKKLKKDETKRAGGVWEYVDEKAAETLQLSKDYTDQSTSDAIDLLKSYTDQAELDAIQQSNDYTDQSSSDAIDLLKTYTDQAEADAIQQSNEYADQAKVEAIELSNAYTDQSTNVAIDQLKAYTDQAEADAIQQSNMHTDQAKAEAIAESITLIDSKIEENTCPHLTWNNNGIGIGTTDNGNYKLAVDGTIGAREVRITTDAWADFVFEDNYDLMTLKELDDFIRKNKHLPEIPTTEEVEENGISVGEMNAKLLQKIEELTIYTIKQQEVIKDLLLRIEKLETNNGVTCKQ